MPTTVDLVEGVRWGSVLGLFAIVFGILGLTPSLAWIPELPLLVVGTAVPLLLLAGAGLRASSQSGRIASGLTAGVVAGVIGGIAGGLCYIAFGKSLLNLPIGLLAGGAGGAVIGGLSGLLGRRRTIKGRQAPKKARP